MSKAVLEQSNYKPTEVTRQDPRWGARLGAAPPQTLSHRVRTDPARLDSVLQPGASGVLEPEEPAAPQRMLQKNFFSRNGFSEAGTGTMSGSSRTWASQYAIRSAAALDT